MSYATKRPLRYPALKLPPPLLLPGGRVTLFFPIPTRACSPNACRGQSKAAALGKARAIRAHRLLAQFAMRQAGVTEPDFTGYSLAFYFPTSAFRDDDNADASIKAYRDGIAQALRMNDRHMRKCRLSSYAKDAKLPRVEITLWPRELNPSTE